MEIKIEIELEIEELRAIIAGLQRRVRVDIPPTIAETTLNTEEPESTLNTETEYALEDDLDVEHDCLEEVEFEVIEDWDCAFTVVKCEVCGKDVSEEYEDLYGDDDYEDDYYEAMRELQDQRGDE